MSAIVAQAARCLILALAVALIVSPASRFGFHCAELVVADATGAGAPVRDCCTPEADCAALCQAVPAALQPAPGEPAPVDTKFDLALTEDRPGLGVELIPPPPRSNAV